MALRKPKRIALWFAVIGLIWFVTPLLQVIKGKSPQFVFVVLGVVWLLLSLLAAAKSKARADAPKP